MRNALILITLPLLTFALLNGHHTNYQLLKAKLPIPLMGHITAIYNDNLFVFGGKNGSNNDDIVFNNRFFKLPLSSLSLDISDLKHTYLKNQPSHSDWMEIVVKAPAYGPASNIGAG
eukprot:206855_1